MQMLYKTFVSFREHHMDKSFHRFPATLKSSPSEAEFETLSFKAGGLFVYAAMAINFLSPVGQYSQQRLDLLLREESNVSADIDQIYRQIIAISQNPALHCRLLGSTIRLVQPLPLRDLEKLFHADKENLAVMPEAFSPVTLIPQDGVGNAEIYHTLWGLSCSSFGESVRENLTGCR
ncbi:hypothetical protein DFJ58DRAFT_484607 [Suillus subalutaceus]|uniref:uncharacterized protein n=1 Tax=Suillus subalutaceus TaxID=48586 RepID=UPI001B860C9C|nr:uncharacterized protein DFJ58DRAFT_484607 [Suillus subalutaceus]KAG1847151.1 hypothetical protein DFJ58DRAFT_484607 [Suillus subalutaceus]